MLPVHALVLPDNLLVLLEAMLAEPKGGVTIA
jgi:hypothetical protein